MSCHNEVSQLLSGRSLELLEWSVRISAMSLNVPYLACDGFRLLSLSVLLLVVTQRFGRYILRPSSGFSCLSVLRNDLTWEIIFKVCRSDKAIKKYEDVIQIMTSLVFTSINPRSFMKSVMKWTWNIKSNGISYSWYF